MAKKKKTEPIRLSDLSKDPERLLTTDQVKEVLGVSNPTLYRWRRDKVVKCYKIGGVYKYMASDVLKYLEENTL